MNVVLFLWDQYVIGMDSPGFHDDYLSTVTAIFLMLLKDKLVQCNSVSFLNVILLSITMDISEP